MLHFQSKQFSWVHWLSQSGSFLLIFCRKGLRIFHRKNPNLERKGLGVRVTANEDENREETPLHQVTEILQNSKKLCSPWYLETLCLMSLLTLVWKFIEKDHPQRKLKKIFVDIMEPQSDQIFLFSHFVLQNCRISVTLRSGVSSLFPSSLSVTLTPIP